MGEISDRTKLGLVTYVDDHYNYVWSLNLNALELRFPLNPGAEFQPGEVVRYVQTHDGRSVQILHNLMKTKDQWPEPVQRPQTGQVKWKVRVKITFAPTTSTHYNEIMGSDDEERVKAIAYSDDIQFCVAFNDLEFEVGKVYNAWITRIPKAHDALAKKLGTIFCICGMKLEELNDPNAISQLMDECPWYDDDNNDNDDDIGLPLLKGNGNTTVESNGNVEQHQKSQDIHYYEEEPAATNYAEELHDDEEGEKYTGLIVRCESEYSAIWGPSHGLVRVQLDGQTQNIENPVWPLSTWVHYRCMPELSQLRGGIRCEHTAYDIKRINFHREIITINNTVAARMRLTKAKAHGKQYFIAYENFFKEVLCSCQDNQLKDKMQPDDPNAFVDIYALYTDLYKTSKWVAFAVKLNDSDQWTKVTELPPSIDSEVNPFFERYGNYSEYTPGEEMQQNELLRKKFEAPADWNGSRDLGDKIIDVLGLVTCFENENRTSVIATKYGIARQPTTLKLGTWIRATILPDSRPSPGKNIMRNLPSYVVEYSRKIRPPISTRAVDHDGVTKLLICCNVNVGPNCLENEYLGIIEDPRKIIRFEGSKYINSFLAEICFSRDEQNQNIRFWKVLKNHGEFTKSVHTVALKLSYFPYALGDTCDGAHTVLLDPIFDAKKFYAATQPTETHDYNERIKAELGLYVPCEKNEQVKKQRAVGIVVTKTESYAILYSKGHGDAIMPYQYFQNREVFEQIFKLGEFVGAEFAQVSKVPNRELLYKWMCLPEFKHSKQIIAKRTILQKYVQFYLRCDFRKANIRACTENLSQNECEKKYYIDTEVGPVLLSEDVINKNDLLGKVVELWITHMHKQYGCNWRITHFKMNTMEEDDELDGLKIHVERELGEPRTFLELRAGNIPTFYAEMDNGTPHQKIPSSFAGYDGENLSQDVPAITAQTEDNIDIFNTNNHQYNGNLRDCEQRCSGADYGNSAHNKNTEKLISTGYGDFLYGSHVPDVMAGERYHGERYRPRNTDNDDEGDMSDNNSNLSSSPFESEEEKVESVNDDQESVFSDDSEAFERNMRILGGATPPPPPSRYAILAASAVGTNPSAQQHVPRSSGSFGAGRVDEQQRSHKQNNIPLMNLEEDLIQL